MTKRRPLTAYVPTGDPQIVLIVVGSAERLTGIDRGRWEIDVHKLTLRVEGAWKGEACFAEQPLTPEVSRVLEREYVEQITDELVAAAKDRVEAAEEAARDVGNEPR